MPRKRHKAEEIVTKLRQVDVLTAQGRPVGEAVIIPLLTGRNGRTHAANFNFCAGVIPPMPMLGRALLYIHSHSVAISCTSMMVSKM
jgi:hypothetical protein